MCRQILILGKTNLVKAHRWGLACASLPKEKQGPHYEVKEDWCRIILPCNQDNRDEGVWLFNYFVKAFNGGYAEFDGPGRTCRQDTQHHS
jgi:hypothetical protein